MRKTMQQSAVKFCIRNLSVSGNHNTAGYLMGLQFCPPFCEQEEPAPV